MFSKALGVKYLSRYKSYHAVWQCNMMIQGNKHTYRIDDLLITVERQITGGGVDELGPFKILGTVNHAGKVDFEKRYVKGSLKPVTSYVGQVNNGSISGTWIVKGQDSGPFEMVMLDATPLVITTDNLQATIMMTFIKGGTRVHSVGMIPDATNQGVWRFFILNGKLWEDKNRKEIAMKMVYPDSSHQDYYLGEMVVQDGMISIEGTVETHKTKEWFAKSSNSHFKMNSIPTQPIMNSNYYHNNQHTIGSQHGENKFYIEPYKPPLEQHKP